MVQQSDPTRAPFLIPFPATQITPQPLFLLLCGSSELNSYGERLMGKHFNTENILSLGQSMWSALEVVLTVPVCRDLADFP